MIKIEALTFQYPGTKQSILRDINLQIPPGSLTLVTGASGSGKSTLLRCINGLIPHFSGGVISGQISVFGLDPIKDGPQKLASEVGFVFQEPEAQFVYDIVEDEIAFALENAGTPYKLMHEKVEEIIQKLSLEDIRHETIKQISGGEKQLVAIASALVGGKSLLILDEPTSQLDPQTADKLLTYITKLKEDLGLTIIIAEHRLERLLPYTDNFLFMQQMESPLFGSPREILTKIDPVPPLIEIAKKLKISPLPVKVEDFPIMETEFPSLGSVSHFDETTNAQPPILSIRDLSVTIYQQKILKSINLQLNKGEILNLIGPNGAGKTTLLRSILGLTPKKGQITLNGQNTEAMDFQNIIQQIAYLPQNPNDLLFAETVFEELLITLKNHGMQKSPSELIGFLTRFGLEGKQDAYPRDLSIGERQRIALAAITVVKSKIILLDEPTRGLDYGAKKALQTLIEDWANQGMAILLVTHDIEFAATVADRVVILEEGKLVFTGKPKLAFTNFYPYQTQTARLFPNTGWIIPQDVTFEK